MYCSMFECIDFGREIMVLKESNYKPCIGSCRGALIEWCWKGV